eukprot:Partr_v1_DN24664_c0_g2_i1_m59785 putative Translocase of outer mitochondrial membrane 40 homolog
MTESPAVDSTAQLDSPVAVTATIPSNEMDGVDVQVKSAGQKKSSFLSWSAYTQWRKSLGLPYPGPFEQLHKEVRGIFTTNFLFDGMKFDMSKGFSPNFNVTHSFHLGSQSLPSSYSFGSFFGGHRGFITGSVDHEGSLQARGSYPVSRDLVTKFQSQIGNAPGQAMLQLEADYSGTDYSLNCKSINASPTDLTGIFVGQYLQSVHPRLALGLEVAHQHPAPEISETNMSVVGKLTGADWALTSNLTQVGAFQTTYYHRVSDQVDLGAELQVAAAGNRREAVCTIGGKWEFRQASFRGQVDTNGRVSAVLEEKMAPGFSVFFVGDIDHLKGDSKFGMGLQLEN